MTHHNQIIEEVKKYFKLKALNKKRSDKMYTAKHVAVYILRTETMLTLKAMAPLIGYKKPACVHGCFKRCLEEMRKDEALVRHIKTINERLKNQA